MQEAQRRLGGVMGSDGSAIGPAWLCLTGGDSAGPWVLWLTSYDIDGGNVGSFEWERLAAGTRFDARCHTLPAGPATVRLPLPMRLGTARTEVEHLLGKPSASRGQTAFYLYEHALTLGHEPSTADNSVGVVYSDGKVRLLTADWLISS